MSEEKLYAVKNDEGEYLLDSSLSMNYPEWTNDLDSTEIFVERYNAVTASNSSGGNVVTFVKEPKKVVISKKDALRQGWLVARYGRYNPDAVSDILAKYKDEAWGMIDAYVSGYTVEKEKKYNVKVPHTEGWHFQKYSSVSKLNDRKPFPANDNDTNLDKSLGLFTKTEIEHYGLQDCEKVWCDSDDE